MDKNLKQARIFLLILLLGIFALPVLAAEHHPEEFLVSIQGSPNAGEKIYTHFCATCHAPNPLISVAAPSMGVKKDWEPYIKNQTVDQMMKVIDSGLGAMPPRGGCFECSDDELKAAIIFMLPK